MLPVLPYPSGAGGFSPKSLPGLLLWLDASDAPTVSGAAGSLVWRDKSGNGYNFSAGAGSLGLAYANNSFNSKPGISFNGANDWIVTAKGAVVFTSQKTSAFIVCHPTPATGGSGRYIAMVGPNAGISDFSNVNGLVYEFNSSTTAFGGFFDNTAFGSVPISAANLRLGSVVDASVPSGTGTLYLNGVSQGVNTLAAAASTWSNQSVGLGVALNTDGSGNPVSAGGTQFAQMVAAEVVIYNSILSAAQITQLDNYFKAKWGL